MQDWDELHYLLALKCGGTMERAAQMLGTSPAIVAAHIKRLSKNFGSLMFLPRKGDCWEITPEGERLAALAGHLQLQLHGAAEVEPDMDYALS